MLSRTASQLYWLGRNVERMDYVARLIDTATRMAVMPAPSVTNEWHSALIAAGSEAAFLKKHDQVTDDRVMDYLTLDHENVSSIISSLRSARQNARAVRAAITSDMWDAINGTFLEGKNLTKTSFDDDNLRSTIDWVEREALLFNGATDHTMLRAMASNFVRLGRYMERADNTARILDVKYHLLLPNYEQVGGSVDYYQWSAILRAVSGRRAYHAIYKKKLKAAQVAELLIIRPELPRSLCSCYREITEVMDRLATAHGKAGECHRLAGATYATLNYGQIQAILDGGLHEFLTDIVDTTARLSVEVDRFYLQ